MKLKVSLDDIINSLTDLDNKFPLLGNIECVIINTTGSDCSTCKENVKWNCKRVLIYNYDKILK